MNQVLVGMVLCMTLLSSSFTQAQQSPATGASAIVPPMVRYSGTLTDINGKPLTTTTGTTFLLYRDEQGGAPSPDGDAKHHARQERALHGRPRFDDGARIAHRPVRFWGGFQHSGNTK